jgi:hypothetical protein
VARTGPQPVVRIRLRRQGERWTVEKQIRIDEMTIPPSYELPAAAGRAHTGAWCEVTDEAGEVIYRKLLPHVPGGSVEVPAVEGGLNRPGEYLEEDEFDVVVPDVPLLHTVNVFVADPGTADVAATVERARTPVASLRLRRTGRGD